MAGGIKVSGTDLNRSMTSDLAIASKMYTDLVPAVLVNKMGPLVKKKLNLDINQVLSGLGDLSRLGLDAVGGSGGMKGKILGLIESLLERDSFGLSKLSLLERTNLFKEDDGCNLGDQDLNTNNNIMGYGVSAVLSMLLCAGEKGIFSLIDDIIDFGVSTARIVAGAVTDVLKSIVGADTINVIVDLANSKYAQAIISAVSGPDRMLLKGIGAHSGPIDNPVQTLNKVMTGMDIMAPGWLEDKNSSGSSSFNMGSVADNTVISKMATYSSVNKEATPEVTEYNINRTFTSIEKIAMFAKKKIKESAFV